MFECLSYEFHFQPLISTISNQFKTRVGILEEKVRKLYSNIPVELFNSTATDGDALRRFSNVKVVSMDLRSEEQIYKQYLLV